MKKCRLCNVYKDPSEYYPNESRCKSCACAMVRANRLKNRDYYIAFDRGRNMKPHRVAARRAYIQTDSGKASRSRASIKYRENYPNAYKSKVTCGNAIRDKRLLKIANCETCGDPSKEAHHDDYNYPLQVRWLCIPCHKEWHRHNTPKNRN